MENPFPVKDTHEDYYVTGIALSQFVLGAERLGLPSRELLARCGLDEAVHMQPMAHVPTPLYEKFILELIFASGDAHGDEALRMAEDLARRQLQAQQQSGSALGQIRLQLHDLMRTGIPRRELVADRLNISVRTLDRRLADAGQTWQSLLDSMRLQLAREYLLRPDMTVRDVAERLGFADIRAFQRRFRTWTGLSPSEYRQR
jgi:AraC-like DNA-binding protein